MIEKLKPLRRESMDEFLDHSKYEGVHWLDWCKKIDEIIDYVNDLASLHKMFEATHNHSKPIGLLTKELTAKLEMHKATLMDLEEEIMKGSI